MPLTTRRTAVNAIRLLEENQGNSLHSSQRGYQHVADDSRLTVRSIVDHMEDFWDLAQKTSCSLPHDLAPEGQSRP
ncbi:hypothetical protein MTO96_033057 [Rhipicephalus appendiculatus]